MKFMVFLVSLFCVNLVLTPIDALARKSKFKVVKTSKKSAPKYLNSDTDTYDYLKIKSGLRIKKETSPLDRKHTLSMEMAGRTLFSGFNYDYMVNDRIALGFGYGKIDILVTTNSLYSTKLTSLPLYMNYYLTNNAHRWTLLAGINFLTVTVDYPESSTTFTSEVNNQSTESLLDFNSFKSSATFLTPNVGTGYEYRSSGGFLFRSNVLLYQFINKFHPVVGLNFGFSF